MFLSKVTLNGSVAAKRELMRILSQGAYANHQILWKLFTREPERSRPYLFREEINQGAPVFYVLSQQRPANDEGIFTYQVKPFAPKLSKGTRLAFQLRANPTITISDGRKNGKVHDVLMHAKHQLKQQGVQEAEQIKQAQQQAALNWLMSEKRLADIGIALPIEPDIISYQQHHSVKSSNKRPIKFSSVDYQGVLEVVDPERFIEKLSKGIGRAKAFGCGLMLIRRV